MQKLLLFGLILLIAIGCEKDDDIGFPVTDGDRLVRFVENYNSDESKIHEYFYDDQHLLIRTEVKNFRIPKRINYYSYDEGKRLKEILGTNYPPLENLENKNEYFYDGENKLSKAIYYTSYDSGATFKKSYWFETKFHYNDKGNLNRKEIIFRDTVKQSSWDFEIENYYYEWDNGNIVKTEEYNRNGVLVFTKFYQYDNKVNYKVFQPEVFHYPEAQTQNNVVRVTRTDHLGYLTYFECRDCKITYNYNRSGKPVVVRSQKIPNTEFVLTYK